MEPTAWRLVELCCPASRRSPGRLRCRTTSLCRCLAGRGWRSRVGWLCRRSCCCCYEKPHSTLNTRSFVLALTVRSLFPCIQAGIVGAVYSQTQILQQEARRERDGASDVLGDKTTSLRRYPSRSGHCTTAAPAAVAARPRTPAHGGGGSRVGSPLPTRRPRQTDRSFVDDPSLLPNQVFLVDKIDATGEPMLHLKVRAGRIADGWKRSRIIAWLSCNNT